MRSDEVRPSVEYHDVARYPQEVEAAAYFCCLEALQNVQKHARATRVIVRVYGASGELTFEVDDGGDGFDPVAVRRGSGLTNMEDRLAALGGALGIRSSRGSTVVTGKCPSVAVAVREPMAI